MLPESIHLEVVTPERRVVSEVVEIAFRNDAERADGRERAAFGAVDLVDAVALPDRSALTAPRQVEIPRERVARISFLVSVALTCTATAPEAAVP